MRECQCTKLNQSLTIDARANAPISTEPQITSRCSLLRTVELDDTWIRVASARPVLRCSIPVAIALLIQMETGTALNAQLALLIIEHIPTCPTSKGNLKNGHVLTQAA